MVTTAFDPTVLGVSGVTVMILLAIVRTLYLDGSKKDKRLAEAQEQSRKDLETVIPALLAATTAMTEVAKVANRMADRERGIGG